MGALGLSSLLPVNLVASLSAYWPGKESSVNWRFMEMGCQVTESIYYS